eukprot:scaffold67210_cov30-Tisochrysis_lutea.AAC.3
MSARCAGSTRWAWSVASTVSRSSAFRLRAASCSSFLRAALLCGVLAAASAASALAFSAACCLASARRRACSCLVRSS